MLEKYQPRSGEWMPHHVVAGRSVCTKCGQPLEYAPVTQGDIYCGKTICCGQQYAFEPLVYVFVKPVGTKPKIPVKKPPLKLKPKAG